MTEITANIERADGAPPPTPGASATAAVPLGQLLAGSCVIVAVWLIAASRWVWTDTVVPWDSKNQFYAFFRFLAASLHSGQQCAIRIRHRHARVEDALLAM